MNPIHTFTNLLHKSISLSQSENQLSLKENQIVHGKVLKLFPDQKALIQIGQSKLVAQLETSMSTKENYWFKVGGSLKQGINLKMVKQVEYDKNSKQAIAKDLVHLFQQKPTRNNVLLAKELMKENIPMTSEQFGAATEIIKNTDKKAIPQTIQAIQYAIKQNFPLTHSIISSLVQTQTEQPLTSQIESIIDNIQKVKSEVPSLNQLTQAIIKLKQNPVNTVIEKVINYIANPEEAMNLTKSEQQTLQKLTVKFQNEQVLNTVKNEIRNMLLSNEQVKKQTLINIEEPIIGPKFISDSELSLIKKISSDMMSFLTKDHVLHTLLDLEKQLGHIKLQTQVLRDNDDQNSMKTLKELLVIASKEVDIPVLRDQIEHLVQRLNGHALLTQDHGPTQQIITQIPLYAINHQSDLTIQWQGKKHQDGTIDPAFCRILFYLQLPKLAETMVDVQIQNRVMTITITNDNAELKKFVSSNFDLIKQSLTEMNYQLTSVSVKPFEINKYRDKPLDLLTNSQGNFSYTGVDFKI
ncbi:hypothetical protein [Metabacillus litoralis]|uniref:hypothetical protein n=1 Tax=Metabacillus litoralis TaxID=152268 RepID=UPI001CFF4888|nr:hypothetical protein [Metabacillus litoralis]